MSRVGRIPRTKIGIVIASDTNPLREVSLRGSRATRSLRSPELVEGPSLGSAGMRLCRFARNNTSCRIATHPSGTRLAATSRAVT
jgi:hypothetical protein